MRNVTRRSFYLPALLFLTAGVESGSTGQEIVLTGAGSTFILPMLTKWKREYTKIHPELKIAYEPVGSGRGISRSLAGTVDFGASDGPMTDQQLKRAAKPILHVPVVLGAVVPAYNLPGVQDDLRFTPEVIVDIYLGKIVKWNDPALARANPNLKLPDHEILPLFRTDGSGTTYIWTDYLSKASAEWKRRIGVGTSVSFPNRRWRAL